MSEQKILIYGNRKANDTYYDISSPEKEAAAYLLLFKELNEEWQVYSDLQEIKTELCEPCVDGQHKYCRGQNEDCDCDANPDCHEKNRKRRIAMATTRGQRELYLKAITGDVGAIKRLMKARRNHEYEEVREGTVFDPLEAA